MSECQNVEKPLLGQLAALGWRVIDQGPAFPIDPARSLRSSFRQVMLRQTLNRAVRAINLTEDGREWLTDKQLDQLHGEQLPLSIQREVVAR